MPPPTGQRGRPRVICEACRPSRAKKPPISTDLGPLKAISGSGPFTVEHFREWASHLVRDNGEFMVLEPFQEAFARDLFSGVPECWLVIPEGNGKTTLVAALALYHCQHTRQAWVPVAAAAAEQATILYRQAEGLVRSSPHLTNVFRCLPGYRWIICEANFSKIAIFSADDKTGDGQIPTLAIVDELHRHRDLQLYRTWRGKLAKRHGQIVAISTAGEPGGEFEQTRANIRDQSVSERSETFLRATSKHLVLHEWAVPDDGDVEDIQLVKRANPFSGITEQILAEKLGSPTLTLPHWRRFTCNLPTRSNNAAIQETEWARAVTDEQIPLNQPVWVGLDVAWKYDTTAIVPLWWKSREERILGPVTVLTPPRDGTMLDGDLIKAAFLELHHRNPVAVVVMDITRAEEVSAWLEDTLGCRVVERAQSNQFAVVDYERFMDCLLYTSPSP